MPPKNTCNHKIIWDKDDRGIATYCCCKLCEDQWELKEQGWSYIEPAGVVIPRRSAYRRPPKRGKVKMR